MPFLKIVGLIELGFAFACGLLDLLLLVIFLMGRNDPNSRGITFVIIALVITTLLTLLLFAMGFTATRLDKLSHKVGQINAKRIALGLQIFGGFIVALLLSLTVII